MCSGNEKRRHILIMINVHPKGRLGNQMFQYCLARIISDKLDYATDMNLPLDNSIISSVKAIKSPVEQLKRHECDFNVLLTK